MMIIGCDFHPSWQQVSWLDTETGETGDQKLVHAEGQAQKFYQGLSNSGRASTRPAPRREGHDFQSCRKARHYYAALAAEVRCPVEFPPQRLKPRWCSSFSRLEAVPFPFVVDTQLLFPFVIESRFSLAAILRTRTLLQFSLP